MPVWLENDAPNTTSRSDSFISHDATGVPLRPSTPQPSGWRSEIWPLALKVVSTGAPSSSARATTSSMSKRAPWPTTIDRAAGRRRCASTARASASAGGAIPGRRPGPPAPPAGRSGAGWTWTSSGRTRWATPRPTSARLEGQRRQLGVVGVGQDVWEKSATSAKAPVRSRSWKAPRPEDLGRHLSGDGQDRGPVDLGVVEAGEQVGRPGAGDGEAGGRAAGELAVGGGGEGGRALVADADVGQLAPLLGPAHGVGEAEVGVADHAEHVGDAPGHHGLDHDVGDVPPVLGQRRDGDVDPVVAHLDREGLRGVAEPGRRLAGDRVVVVAVPGAAQQPVLDRALPEGSALVGAVVVQGAVAAAAVGQGDGAGAGHRGADPALGEVARLGHLVPGGSAATGHRWGRSPAPPP